MAKRTRITVISLMNNHPLKTKLLSSIILLTIFSSFMYLQKEKPVFFIIGDSTVKNGDGTGKSNLWGWGNFVAGYFDTSRIKIENNALGGRSSRTFITEGRWDKILNKLKKGDYVIMQFGHNDASPLDDTARARGTIRGIGEESKETYNPIMKKNEVVYTYGHYMRKYIRDIKAKGAIPIVCSLIPRNNWKDGKLVRANDSYQKWAEQVAKEESAFFVDLHNIIAEKYDAMGPDAVKAFFPSDNTHTDKKGAELNALLLIAELKKINPENLNLYMN